MPIFKFLEKKHVGAMLAGNFRFGRLRYYQLRESIEGDCWIGDVNEGKAINKLAEWKSRRTEIRNFTSVEHSDFYILSLAQGGLSALANEFCNPACPDPYDACIEITDLECLVQTIAEYGKVNGIPFNELFEVPPLHDIVTYESNVGDIIGQRVLPSAFRKGLIYRSQCEYRIAAKPKPGSKMQEDHLYVNVGSRATDCMRERPLDKVVFSDKPPRSKRASVLAKEASDYELIERLKKVACFELTYADPSDWRAGKETQAQYAERSRLKTLADEERFDELELARPLLLSAYWSLRWRNRERYWSEHLDQDIINHTKGFVLIRHLSQYLRNLKGDT